MSAPKLPRSAWKGHKNYPTQALLLGSHDNFRNVSAHLVRESLQAWASAPNTAPQTVHLSLFRRWKSAMKSHEGYEETKLYPFLNAKYGVSMAVLELHHRQLGLAEARVYKVHQSGNALQVAHAFKAHDEILVPHLTQEEDIVIPLLLSLTPSEFEAYSHSSITTLLRRLNAENNNHGKSH